MNRQEATAWKREWRSLMLRWAVLLAALGAFATWSTCRMVNAGRNGMAAADRSDDRSREPREPEIEYWTCTMHPEIREQEPGECPICGMELVEKYVGSNQPGVRPETADADQTTADSRERANQAPEGQGSSREWYRCTMPECGDQGSDDPESRCPVCGMKRERVDSGSDHAHVADNEIALSDRARRLAEVATEEVQRRRLLKRIRAVGRVTYDETRQKMVSAWIGGRIDKLFADFTGMTVSQGDHLVEIYSPELLSTQQEYLQALRSVRDAGARTTEVSRRSSEQVVEAARRKLALLGVTDEQIENIERSGQPQTHLVVYAPIGGTITAKQAMEGKYVKTGDPLYTIADLRHLWLLVDVYESDLPWVSPFQQVRVTTRSLPGEVFTGEIVFVDPRVDPATRTVPVRIHVENPARRLKPDMWVAAEINAVMGRGGRGAVSPPAGTMACPMHPWERSDHPARCPICLMDMVPVSALPQHTAAVEPARLLSVPRGAVMQTGERVLVYVESSPGVYRGVEIVVGPLATADDGKEYYPVLGGLTEGARVVMRGTFAIDSQMQLAGKPSLFTARGLDDEPTPMEDADEPSTGERQTTCPVMGGDIDPEVFITFKGIKIHFCCWGCDDRFLADPEKYVDRLPPTMAAKVRAAMESEQRSQP